MKAFSIVGAGRLGTTLAAALVRRGWKLEVIVDRRAGAAREARRIIGAGRVSTSPLAAAKAEGTVIIAVPDDSIAAVTATLALSGVSWTGRDVFHTSGRFTSGALIPLANRGARVASLHPVQSFPRKDLPASIFKGITWGIDGDRKAVKAAAAIARALGGRVLLLGERTFGPDASLRDLYAIHKKKRRYHAACVLASNALVALEWTAVEVLRSAGVSEEDAVRTLLPLAQGTLQNVKSLGPEKALTGPIARGDIYTVREHLIALRSDPAARQTYKALGRQTLRLATARGLPPGTVRALKRLLSGR